MGGICKVAATPARIKLQYVPEIVISEIAAPRPRPYINRSILRMWTHLPPKMQGLQFEELGLPVTGGVVEALTD